MNEKQSREVSRWMGWAIAIVALAVLVFNWRAGADGKDLQEVLSRLDRLESSVSTLQTTTPKSGAVMGAGQAHQAASFQPRPSFGQQAQSGPEMPDDPQVQKIDRDRREALAAAFKAQASAPASDVVPQNVVGAFNSENVIGAPFVPESRNVKCRAQTCLISARFPPGADDSDWLARLMIELGDSLPQYTTTTVRTPDGGLELRIYASRTP